MDHITFSEIVKHFPRQLLLEDISITLERGSVIILTGKNGAGKTTLLRILAGLEKPQSCTVDFGDQLMDWRRARKKLLKLFMYLHQRPYMFAGTVSHNLALALPRKLNSKKKAERIREAVEWGMLDQHASELAKTLSGGQQQRLALARAWLRRSRYLLLDEPVSNMDQQSSARTVKLLQRLKTAGTALVVCSHNIQVFDGIADRHMVLDNGGLKSLDNREYGSNVTSMGNRMANGIIAKLVD